MRYEAQREARAAAQQTPRSSILASSSHLQRIAAFNTESDRRRASEIQVRHMYSPVLSIGSYWENLFSQFTALISLQLFT